MINNNQNKKTLFVCDIIMKKALIKASEKMNTSQSKVIQLALSQFLRDVIAEELNNTCSEENKTISESHNSPKPLAEGDSFSVETCPKPINTNQEVKEVFK